MEHDYQHENRTAEEEEETEEGIQNAKEMMLMMLMNEMMLMMLMNEMMMQMQISMPSPLSHMASICSCDCFASSSISSR